MDEGKRLKFSLKVEIDLIPDGGSYVYEIKGGGTQSFVCPDHVGSHEDIRKCVLDKILFLFDTYALEDDEKLSGDAIDLKTRLLSHAKVEEVN